MGTYIIMADCKELKKCAERIEKHLETFHQQVENLYTNDLSKLGKSWKGDENQGYISGLNDYIEDLKKLEQSITAYATFAKTAAAKYENTVSEAASIAATIKN